MATDTERAWHVFTFHPQYLSWRFYRTHLHTFDVDRRIELLKDEGAWPPPVHMAKRWTDIGDLLRLTESPESVDRYAVTLDTVSNRLSIADSRVIR